MNAASFWWWLSIACLVWYTCVTAYVSVRGALDIKSMLARLSDSQSEELATQNKENANQY